MSERSSRIVDTSDNQLEHRSAELAARAESSEPTGPDPRPEATAKDASARKKKKHKPVADTPEHPDAPSTSPKPRKAKSVRQAKAAAPGPEPPASVQEPAAEPALKPKRSKRPKRPVLDTPAPPAQSEPAETDVARAPGPSLPVQTTTTSSRKRAERASLLKTLLWKVKASPPPSSLPLPSDVSVLRPSLRSESDGSDDELAFAAAERETRKRVALETAAAKTLQRCSLASSSQETQSGSDDEAFSPFSLVPSADAPVAAASSCFPTPLALDAIERALSPRAQVHEITLDNFAFSPSEVAIVKGDVVVWRVREDTPALVEHALEATLFDESGATPVRKTATPTLRPGSAFGWRFDAPGRLDVTCSVYHATCTVVISASVAAKRRAAALAPVAPKPHTTKSGASKRRAKRVTAAPEPTSNASDAVDELTDDVAVFHPAPDLAHVPEADAGVCRAVLAHLEDVQAAAAAAFIVVGDVACPLADAPAEPSDCDEANDDDVSDFAQRILAMLARSEAHLAQHRSSFDVLGSGFDARAAVDFFKQRYALAAADPLVAYVRCPERSSL